ncbi:xylanase [Duganella sp. Leaf126]|uniref:glycoside hydrolase family 30 protein n=1 Tax=Duganella sp. Leaf126 TaxID=1736266 RepID=UPI0006F3F3BE|nr:glycoside hydrolase family 30 beta sandwich domain-containing protein [Duganella sp. Leaf126]KQQ36247.1 xylanase [Duganella sp. Leaf126]
MNKVMLNGAVRALLLSAALGAGSLAQAQVVTINPATTYQQIRGFGGFNGPDWIADLTPAQVDTAFGTGNGQMGLSMMRMRISPDSNAWRSQVPTAVLAKAKGVTLFASPWSPPASMKTNNSLIQGSLKPASYGDYATHLLNFASFMQNNGAALYGISVQNEPDFEAPYEGCSWTSSQFISFLSGQGSRFGALKVIAPESLRSDKAIATPILNDSGAAQHLDVIGGHLYGTTPSEFPLAAAKGKEVWMTEHYTDNTDANNWSAALPVALEIHNSMIAKYNAYIWWYIRRSYGLMTEDGLLSKRGYIMAQYAKYVRPGYTRIAATANPYSDVFVTAYKNSSGKIVVVAINNGTAQRQLQLTFSSGAPASLQKTRTSSSTNNEYGGQYAVSGGVATAFIDPGSVSTFVSP